MIFSPHSWFFFDYNAKWAERQFLIGGPFFTKARFRCILEQ
jgi:hypothetical protein